jgi:hypothetical protein
MSSNNMVHRDPHSTFPTGTAKYRTGFMASPEQGQVVASATLLAFERRLETRIEYVRATDAKAPPLDVTTATNLASTRIAHNYSSTHGDCTRVGMPVAE